MRFLSYKKGVLGLGFHYVRPLTPRTTQQPLEREKKKKRNGREDEKILILFSLIFLEFLLIIGS